MTDFEERLIDNSRFLEDEINELKRENKALKQANIELFNKNKSLNETLEKIKDKIMIEPEDWKRFKTLDNKIFNILAVINQPMNNYASCIKAFDEIEEIIGGESNE